VVRCKILLPGIVFHNRKELDFTSSLLEGSERYGLGIFSEHQNGEAWEIGVINNTSLYEIPVIILT